MSMLDKLKVIVGQATIWKEELPPTTEKTEFQMSQTDCVVPCIELPTHSASSLIDWVTIPRRDESQAFVIKK